jgi:hypothetical protein
MFAKLWFGANFLRESAPARVHSRTLFFFRPGGTFIEFAFSSPAASCRKRFPAKRQKRKIAVQRLHVFSEAGPLTPFVKALENKKKF